MYHLDEKPTRLLDLPVFRIIQLIVLYLPSCFALFNRYSTPLSTFSHPPPAMRITSRLFQTNQAGKQFIHLLFALFYV